MVYTENCNRHKQGARLRHSGKINKVDNDKKSRNENALISTFKLIFRRHFLPAWTLSCNSDTITTSAHTHNRHECRGLFVGNWHVKKMVFLHYSGGIFILHPRQPIYFRHRVASERYTAPRHRVQTQKYHSSIIRREGDWSQPRSLKTPFRLLSTFLDQ